MNTLLLFAIFLLAGYYLSLHISHPKKNKHRIPRIAYKNIEFMPNFRIHIGSKTYWLHHWFYLSVIIVGAVLIYDNMMHSTTVKAAASAAVGGIIQGLRYPDRFKFRHPRSH
jgi:hypothetical protein